MARRTSRFPDFQVRNLSQNPVSDGYASPHQMLELRCGDDLDRLLMIDGALVFLLGVQLPMVVVNLPLNNQLQRLDVVSLSETPLRHAREAFEPRWNRWNVIRTACACLATVLLLLLPQRL